MDEKATGEDLRLLEHVKALENKSPPARRKELQSRLGALGLKAEIQEWGFPRIRNLVIDFTPHPDERRLLFSAHYDAVPDSPGANDNASSVAVLLGLCQKLRGIETPVRVVFFDREEGSWRTPFFRLGVLGSLYYVFRNNLRNIEAAYNLEFCGAGDSLTIWPVKSGQGENSAVKAAWEAAAKLDINVKLAEVPALLFSSDHRSFRLRGLSNSLTLSLLPTDEVPVLEESVSNLSVTKLLSGHKLVMPGVLSRIHKRSDDSSRLSEDSLRLMLSVLVEIIQSYKLRKRA